MGESLNHKHINERYGVTVLEVIRPPEEVYLEEAGTISLQPDDLLVVQGAADDILRLPAASRD